MVQSVMVRAVRGMLRLPATRPQFYSKVALDRVHRFSFWLARRGAAHGLVPTDGGNSVDDSAVGGARDERVGLGPFLRNPIDDMEPLPLGVPIPVTMAVPRHQASNGDGFVFLIEATCECLCELYTPVAAAHIRDVIVSTAQEAAKAEMIQGDWQYESLNQGWTKGWERERYAERVMARMVSASRSSGDNSMTIDFTKYSVTTARLEPAATLAFAATQSRDPAVPLLAASLAELIVQINMDGARLRTMLEKVEAASKATSNFTKIYGFDKPVPPPQRRRWILSLLQTLLAVALLLPVSLLVYSHFFPEEWAARKDAVVADYAQSFKYHASGGVFGETMVQKQQRVIAEAQQQKQEEERKKMEEEERVKKEQERKRKEEEDEARRRAEALAERLMTPWERFLYRANVGDRRFERYRRP